MGVKFKPLKDRVFVSYTEELEKTAGGLYIPDSAKEKPQSGKVEAVGDEVKSLKVGDKILFDRYSGSKISIDNVDYLIIKEEDVLGILS
jgi:chaperonin GroES